MIPQYITVQNAHQYKTDEKEGERDFFDTLFTFPSPHEKNQYEAQRDQQKHPRYFCKQCEGERIGARRFCCEGDMGEFMQAETRPRTVLIRLHREIWFQENVGD